MYDLAIIGAGAAGVECGKIAIKSGLRAILIEQGQESFGGTCLNNGCIPTKYFLQSSKAKNSWEQSFEGSSETINKIKTPLISFLAKGGLDIVWGKACFIDKNTISVGNEKIEAKNIVIATGSKPKKVFNNPKVIFAQDLFKTAQLANKFLVVGAGYVGIEIASLLRNFGKEVQLVEKEKQILPSFDSSLSKRLEIVLKKKGIVIDLGREINEDYFKDFDVVISAVGRESNGDNLGLRNIGLDIDEGGWIRTDEYMRTNIKNIYACGDITGKMMLAYVAEHQAGVCVDNIKGIPTTEDYSGVPACVFSIPALAKVGVLEQEAKSRGIKHRVIKSNFHRFSSAYVYGDLDGFIQVVIDSQERIIGAGVISQVAGELISIFALSIKNNLKLNDLKKCLFVHPTLSEIIPLLLNSD